MKTFLAVTMAFFSLTAFASNLYDNQVTKCQNGAFKLTIEGKQSLFGSRRIVVHKNNQVVLDENYAEKFFPYSDRNGSSVMGNEEFRSIISYAHKVKPHSIAQDMDYNFRVSNNAIVLQTFSPLQPEFGGDTQSIILELVPYKTLVVFELATQCKISRD